MQLFGSKGQEFHHLPRTKGHRDKLKILPRAGTAKIRDGTWDKSGPFFEIFKFILSQDVPGQRSLSRDICFCPCPGTRGHRDRQNFFVPGQRDNGTRKLFCPGTKGQRDVPRTYFFLIILATFQATLTNLAK